MKFPICTILFYALNWREVFSSSSYCGNEKECYLAPIIHVGAMLYDPVSANITRTPVVLMHGMGDAASNAGMISLRNAISARLGGAYATNIQIGQTWEEDTRNGYLMNLNKQVALFAEEIRRNANLTEGFNAIGFSQGNLIIRGYIERFNDPPVKNFVSVHGPMAGVGALPNCKPSAIMCRKITELVSRAAYSDQVQEHITQANFYRVPTRIKEYLEHALFLPDINNEKKEKNETYKKNFLKLESLALVRAKKDTMVSPKESEWFGAFEDNSYTHVLTMNETSWYKDDSFGLKTLHQTKRLHFLETTGDHLQFGKAELMKWVDAFFRDQRSDLTAVE